MQPVPLTQIAIDLERELGLALEGSFEELEGGTFAIVRPTRPAKPFGLSVMLSRNSRRVEAALRLDNQAGEILQMLAASDSVQRHIFCSLIGIYSTESIATQVVIDSGRISHPEDFPSIRWDEITIECEVRFPHISSDVTIVHESYVRAARACLLLTLSLLEVEPVEDAPEAAEVEGHPEGARTTVQVNRYERNPLNRAACLAHFGTYCQACGFNFESMYGAIGREYIQAHHITPVSHMPADYRVNPITDLVPLCANCHAMVHRRNPPYSVSELQNLMNAKPEVNSASF